MLKIRLSRVGKRNTPMFRLVVAEKTRAVKREFIEVLGSYNPSDKANGLAVNKDRILYWISQGAQPSDTARNLLCRAEVLPKSERIDIKYAKPQKKKAAKEGGSTAPAVAEKKADEEKVEETVAEEVPVEEVTEEKTDETVEDAKADEAVEEAPVEENKE